MTDAEIAEAREAFDEALDALIAACDHLANEKDDETRASETADEGADHPAD